MESTLYTDEHVEVRVIPQRRVVVVRRTATQGETAGVIASFTRALEASTGTYRGFGLVLDTREAIGRSDPDFERGTEAIRKKLDAVYPRVVLLVRTQAGSLQAQRLARQSGRAALVAFDYEEALALAAAR